MSKYTKITITDTLSFWDNYVEDYTFNPDNTSQFVVWYKLPDDWFDSGKIKEDRLEIIFKYLYGENWQQGNDDGSRSQILRVDENLLSAEQILQKPWLNEKLNCYVISENGSVQKCKQDEF